MEENTEGKVQVWPDVISNDISASAPIHSPTEVKISLRIVFTYLSFQHYNAEVSEDLPISRPPPVHLLSK